MRFTKKNDGIARRLAKATAIVSGENKHHATEVAQALSIVTLLIGNSAKASRTFCLRRYPLIRKGDL